MGSTLLAVDIVGPFLDDLLRGPAAPVVALPGRAVVLGLLILSIDILCFPGYCCGSLLSFRPRCMVPPDMVSLPARVPSLPLVTVATVMVPPLPGLLLVLPSLLLWLG